jgi:hypothetical protein
MKERKFDISWIEPPSRGGDDEEFRTPISPFPISGGSLIPDDDDLRRVHRPREQNLDERLLRVLLESPDLHIVDLAARVGVEFEDTLRSVLRLAARREVIIKQRDPVANDHLVSLPRFAAEAQR